MPELLLSSKCSFCFSSPPVLLCSFSLSARTPDQCSRFSDFFILLSPLLLSDTVFVLLHFDRCVEEEVNNDDEDEKPNVEIVYVAASTTQARRIENEILKVWNFFFVRRLLSPSRGPLYSRGKGEMFRFLLFSTLCVDDVHNRGHEMAPLRCSYFSSRNSSTVGGFFFCSCNFFSQRATPT